jgi:hypothetical protein
VFSSVLKKLLTHSVECSQAKDLTIEDQHKKRV